MEKRCEGWFLSCDEPLSKACEEGYYCDVTFKEESPSVVPEERWSLELHSNMWGGNVYTFITGLEGSRLLELRGFVKSPQWNSYLSLYRVKDGEDIQVISDTVNQEEWTQVIEQVVLPLEKTDTLKVEISVGYGDFCWPCTGYFDFIELRDLGEVSGFSDYTLNDGIRLQNNPTYDWVIVKGVEPANVEKLVVQNNMGQDIVSLEYTDAFHTLKMLPGFYLVQIKLTDGNLVTRQFVKR